MTAPDHTVDEDGDRFDELEVGLDSGAEEGVALPWSLVWQRRVSQRVADGPKGPWIVLFASLLGVFTAAFTITVLTVSLADVADDLDSTAGTLTWAVTGPVLAMAVLGPVAGKLADRIGARTVYLWSLVGVAVFAVLCAVAWDATSLIVARFGGAALGAAAGPAALAMINRSFPRERRAQALGYWSLVIAGAPVLGVMIGGPLVDAASWRMIFVLQAPIAVAGVVIGFLVLPTVPRGPREPFDVAGSALLALGVGSILVALNRGSTAGWSNPLVLGGFLLGPVLLAAFVVVELRTPHPLLPMPWFRQRSFSFAMGALFFAQFTYMGGFILTPLLLQEVLGYSVSRTGLVSIARPLAYSVFGPLAGWLVVRRGERTVGAAGGLALAASMVGLAMITADTGVWWIEGSLVLSGIGMGAMTPSMTASVANSVDAADLGVASAASQTMGQMGTVAGMQILLAVQSTVGAESDAGSYSVAYMVACGTALASAVAAGLVRAGRPAEVAVATAR